MKEIIKEIIEFDLDEGRMDYLDDMIDVFSKDGCEMVDILFDRFLKKYYTPAGCTSGYGSNRPFQRYPVRSRTEHQDYQS